MRPLCVSASACLHNGPKETSDYRAIMASIASERHLLHAVELLSGSVDVQLCCWWISAPEAGHGARIASDTQLQWTGD